MKEVYQLRKEKEMRMQICFQNSTHCCKSCLDYMAGIKMGSMKDNHVLQVSLQM